VYKQFIKIIFGLLLLSHTLLGQEISPKGGFQSDSIKIGISIPYSLSIKYPSRMDVVFPDSLYDYSPFELEGKQYFNTKSDSTFSYDSAVYYLSTFEIDSVQYLQLPVYFVNITDSIPVFATKDSVMLVELIPVLPDSIQLIENTTYFNVPSEFNYPYLIIGLSILLITVIILLIIFGGRIKKFFQIRRLKKRHRKFLDRYDQLINGISAESTIEEKGHAAFIWKKYLEKLEKLPITKLTTKEFVSILDPTDEVISALKDVDKALYSNRQSESLDSSYDALRTDAINRYQHKVALIKQNG
jgi:hypothetical protein